MTNMNRLQIGFKCSWAVNYFPCSVFCRVLLYWVDASFWLRLAKLTGTKKIFFYSFWRNAIYNEGVSQIWFSTETLENFYWLIHISVRMYWVILKWFTSPSNKFVKLSLVNFLMRNWISLQNISFLKGFKIALS